MNGMKIGLLASLFGVMFVGFIVFFMLAVTPSFLMIGIVVFAGLMFFVVLLGRSIMSGALEAKAKMKMLCPNCERQINSDSSYCIHCGEAVTKTIECDYCGAQNLLTDSVCSECNALLK